MSKPSNLTVKPRRKESQEGMVKRFIKKCKSLESLTKLKIVDSSNQTPKREMKEKEKEEEQ